jgi:hypothetical protein
MRAAELAIDSIAFVSPDVLLPHKPLKGEAPASAKKGSNKKK